MSSVQPKWFLFSRTNIVAVLTFLVSFFTFLRGQELVAAYPKVVSAIGMAIGVIVMILRFITEVPVTFMKPPANEDTSDL